MLKVICVRWRGLGWEFQSFLRAFQRRIDYDEGVCPRSRTVDALIDIVSGKGPNSVILAVETCDVT